MEFNLVSGMKLNPSSPMPFTLTGGGVPTRRGSLGRLPGRGWLGTKATELQHKASLRRPRKSTVSPRAPSQPPLPSYALLTGAWVSGAWVSVKGQTEQLPL